MLRKVSLGFVRFRKVAFWQHHATSRNFTKHHVTCKLGLTLIEILVAVSIVTLVLTVGFGALRVYNVSVNMAQTRSDLSAQANMALNKMITELGRSGVSKVTFNDGDATDPLVLDEVTFQIIQGIDNNGDIIWGNGAEVGGFIRYLVDPTGNLYAAGASKQNLLIRQQLMDPDSSPIDTIVLANDITNLQFPLPYNDNIVDINITAAKGAVSVAMSTQVVLKN